MIGRILQRLTFLAVLGLAGGLVVTPVMAAEKSALVAAADDDDINDPIEPVNRVIFNVNEVIHEAVLRPVANAYNEYVPATARMGVGNFLTNLSSPVTFVNNVLQGDIHAALSTVVRFFINSTIGIGGIADVVGEVDGELREEDFGQTLGFWGMGEGFYLVLPIFGPSNPRDLVGKFLVDPYFSPFGMWVSNTERDAVGFAETGASGIDEYAGVSDELEQIKKTSVDYYAAIRSLYRQKRKSEISNGENLDLPPIPNLSYDLVPEDFGQPLAGVGGTPGAAR